MNKYVKTTKGIYELKPNRTIEDDWLWETREVMTEDGWDEQECLIGKVLTQSENMTSFIDEVGLKDKNGIIILQIDEISNVNCERILQNWKEIADDNNITLVGYTQIEDDFLKTYEWDSEKGEWKLYER